jgi:hypothetical protein
VLADYRAAADDERRREGEAREEASRTFHRGTHPVTRRSQCCVAPPDGKRGCGTGDLRDNGGSDDDPPSSSSSSSSSSSYEDDDADIRRRGPGGGAQCDPALLIKNT